MRIWIDLANSPHVPLFRVLVPELRAQGHTVDFSARDFAQTVALAEDAELNATVIGIHGGSRANRKAGNLVARAQSLRKWAKSYRFDLALSHNSYSQILAAWMSGIPSVTMMDYEHQPANHLAFRLATRVVVPNAFPNKSLRKFGAGKKKIRRYDGIKEDIYLADFEPDEGFVNVLRKLGISENEKLIVVRPPAYQALYHRFENELFDVMLEKLAAENGLKVILLPRNESQREHYKARNYINFVFPERPLDGSNLVFAADLVISGGGTMNREAAALGVPAATIYAGEWAAIDERLVQDGRLTRITSVEDLAKLNRSSSTALQGRRKCGVRSEVVSLILEGFGNRKTVKPEKPK